MGEVVHHPPARPLGARLLVVCYHNVAPTWCWPDPPGHGLDGLVAQVRLLRRMGTIVRLGAYLADLAAGRRVPRRPIALTFDDGYRDNLRDAVPALERMGVPASFYLVPGLLDRTTAAWWEVLPWAVRNARAPHVDVEEGRIVAGDVAQPALAAFVARVKRADRITRERLVADVAEAFDPEGDPGMDRLFMDWDEARDLAARMEVGAHTSSHAILARETPAAQREDLAATRRRLQDELGVPAEVLAYPNGQPGDQDGHTLAAAAAAGYAAAVTTVTGVNAQADDRLLLRRVVLDPARGAAGLKIVARAAGLPRFLAGR